MQSPCAAALVAALTIASALFVLVDSVFNYFHPKGRGPTALVESITVAGMVFIIASALIMYGRTFLPVLQRLRGVTRWLGAVATSVIGGVITELVLRLIDHR